MNVLVIGGAGYIGSHTVQSLRKEKASGFNRIIVFDDLSTGFRSSVPEGVDFVVGDVRDTVALTRVMVEHKISAVIHFAAKLIVPESVREPLAYYSTNVAGVISLAQACKEAGVKNLIFSSTAAVYGNASGEEPVTEESWPKPINPYGYSKLMAERILFDCTAAFGLKLVVLRYFNVAGAAVDGSNGQRTSNVTHLIQVACQTAQNKRPFLEVFGQDFATIDGTGVRDYIHVEDLAELHVLALNYLNTGGSSEILNCGYGRGFSVNEVIASVKRISGRDFLVKKIGRREGDPAIIVADSSKIQKLFSWSPKFNNLDLICKTAYEWELKQQR